MKVYALLHERWYPSVEILLNFVGTATWAGNVAIYIVPEKVPADYNSQETDNYLRTYKYQQHDLSSNGTLQFFLDRLVNSTQSNPMWDDVNDIQSTGPYIYIQLATQYEQALNNPDTNFQIQILSRFGKAVSFGGLNVRNISKTIAAISGTPSITNPGAAGFLSIFNGKSFKEFLEAVIGFGYEQDPSLVINGNVYSDIADGTAKQVTYRVGHHTFIPDAEFQPCSFSIPLFQTPEDQSYVRNQIIGRTIPRIPPEEDNLHPNFVAVPTGVSVCVPWLNEEGQATHFYTNGIFPLTNVSYEIAAVVLRNTLFSLTTYDRIDEIPPWNGIACGNILSWTPNYQQIYDMTLDRAMVNQADPPELTMNRIAQDLTDKGYNVTFRPLPIFMDLQGRIGDQATWQVNGAELDPSSGKCLGGILFRVEKNGVVDTFIWWFAYEIEIQVNPNTILFGTAALSLSRPPSFETPVQQLNGVLLPEGFRRFELNCDPIPINSSTNIPVALKSETALFNKVLQQWTPPNLVTSIHVGSNLTGRRAFVILFNPLIGIPTIYFTENMPQHAVFNGATLKNLTITSIEGITLTSTTPRSDPSLWTSIEVQGNNLSMVIRNIERIRRPKHKDNVIHQAIQTALRDYERSKKQEEQVKEDTKKMARITHAHRSKPKVVQQFQLLQINSKPRQLTFGKGAAIDRQIAGILMGGMGQVGRAEAYFL